MSTDTICLNINNNIVSISNNNYIINDISSIKTYGLFVYDNSDSQAYYLKNIPRNKPLRFFIDGSHNNNSGNDISHIIEVSYDGSTIPIYVSKGNDISFNNGDYFRFYDESFNLININNHNPSLTTLTNIKDNFYFMNDVSYQFIATTDFSSAFPFSISGNGISSNDYKLLLSDNSFIINIPIDTDNSNNKIFYFDLCNQNISGELVIAIDNSENKYYYDNIRFSIKPEISNNDISLSIISISNSLNPLDGDISNINFFKYNSNCNYIIDETNIIANQLSINNRECLNKISKADFSNGNFYEFNVNNHFNNNIINAVNNDLSYVIYDGTYYIIDLCINYPIKVNNDFSNIVIIDTSYTNQYYNFSDISLINDIKYYFGAIKLKVENNNNYQNGEILNNILEVYNGDDISYITFIYSDQCLQPDSVNEIESKEKFTLINQKHIEFSDNYYEDVENHYILNIYDNYSEPSNNYGFIARDFYGNNLSNLVINNAPTDLSDILTKTNNYTISSFLITYNLTTYNEETFELYRFVNINYGPFTEISGLPLYYYFNDNSFNNIINISNNLHSPVDLSNINVYLKNGNNDNRINLKFDIEFSNNQQKRYNKMSTNKDPSYETILIEDISYNKNVIFPNSSSGQKYYLSRNLLHFKYDNSNSNTLFNSGADNIQQNPLVLKNSSNIRFDNADSKILNDKFILSFSNLDRFNDESSKSYIDYSNNLNNNLNETFITFYSKDTDSSFEVQNIKENVKYKDLDNSFGLIELIQTANDDSDNLIHTKLYLDDEKFIIDFSFDNTDFSDHNVTISGDFLQPKIFSNSSIDVSYIGNYQIKILPLGLDNRDNFYTTISNDFSNIPFSSDISKIYNINIIDDLIPNIAFSNTDNPNPNNYEYNFPRDSSFQLIPTTNNFDTSNSLFFLSDACNNLFIEQKRENSLKPIIVFNDDSIYNLDLSYSLSLNDFSNIKLPIINNVLDVSNKNQDASAIINYFGIDLCGNKSSEISLTILFKNIPLLSLSGEIVFELEIGKSYSEPGILIDNIFYNFNNFSLTEPSSNFFTNEGLGSNYYDISFDATDLCLNEAGFYTISYEVIYYNVSTATSTVLKRFIKVEDNSPPFILFPDLSLINYDFSSSNSNDILATLNSLNDISYAIDNSSSIIDFSLSLFSNISDLSKIIYDFTLADNYSKYINDVSVTSISLEIISISGDISSINLTTSSLSDISTFLYNNSYINIDGSFNILTKSSDLCLNYSYYKPELSFNYIITDICSNSFNFMRNVNIINYDISPNIFFTKNSSTIDDLSNLNIVKYNTISKIDFSYQAHNYKKNPTLFIDEISNILFNFDISDQFSEIHNIDLNSNVLISISNNNFTTSDPSIIRLNNLSNLYVDSFNTISNNSFYLSISNILEQFSIIDNCFQLIYDFSNNQDLSNRQIRNVTIVNTISCDISVSYEFSQTSANTINISFGDTDFSFTNFFTLSHPRLEDISFELSYNTIPQDFSSIIGDVSFDDSALIYQYTDNSNIKSYNFSFYNTINNDSTLDSSKIDISINIIIDPPFLTESSSLSTITHPAGTYISDLNLIENVSFFSKFDEFYYYHNFINDISYSETNFTLSFEKLGTTTSEFNQSFPISDLSGNANYKIIYDVSDANNTFKRFPRELIIQDNTPPIITLFDQDPIDVEEFLQSQSFNIVGVSIQDSFSYLKTIDVSINLHIGTYLQDISSYSINISNAISFSQDITYTLNFNDISNFADGFSDITIETSYKVTDIKDNSATDTNSITLNFSDLIKLNIAILYQDDSFNLNEDFYIPRDNSENWFLKYENITQKITYDASINDISFNFSIDSSKRDINPLLNQNTEIIPNINDICFIDVCNTNLYFQLFYIPDTGVPIVKTRILELNIVDKSSPKLSFIDNNTEIFPNINNIILPEVSYNFILDNINNLTIFYDQNKNYNYFTKNESNEIIYNIPSIKINDIANGIIEVSNNINDSSIIIVPDNPNVTYDISISYNDLSGTYLPNINSSNLLDDPSKNFIQIFHVTENNNDIDFSKNRADDISRNIIIQKFPPIINLTYHNDYKKTYHKLYSFYQDLGAQAFDYYDGSNVEIKTIKTINENNLGQQQLTYQAKNNNNNTTQRFRDVHVVDICCIFFNKTKNYNITSISNDFNNNIRYGLYGTETYELSYNFYIDPSSNFYIALKSYKNNTEFDNSNAISINYDQLYNDSSSNVFYNSYDDCSYVKGNVIINVKEDFDRTSLFWIHIDSSSGNIDNSDNFSDLFLYNESCIYYIIDNNLKNITSNEFIEFSVDVSGKNIQSKNPYFMISGNSINEFNFEPTPRKTLHLHYGIYGFKQNKFTNFYNKIKFSYLPDGCHFNIKDNSNADISYIYKDFLLYNNYNDISNISFNNKTDPSYIIYEYTNNVYTDSLAGLNINNNNSYTYLEINATTPSPLYYYSENFSNMGGIIYTKNNINFSKNCVSLNGNILTQNNNNRNIFDHLDFNNITNFNEISNNLLFLSCRFDLSATNPSETNDMSLNKDFIALTQQNITHNIIINKDSNKIIFKKYDDISSITNGDLSQNYLNNNYIIKEDNSNNYLFDSSINFIERYKGNDVLLYKSDIETSANLLETNTINQRLELNALDFFFNNNQLRSNYTNFFSKNKLANNIYKKNNNDKSIYFLKDHFKYNIHEIDYKNLVKLINGNKEYIFFDNNDLLNSNRLIFEPIFDNLFTFNFQIYLDYDNVNLETNYKNYLKNNIFNKNIYSNYDRNEDYLFFDELYISIFSDISGPRESKTDISQSIIFSENTIFINEPFLDSSNNPYTIDTTFNTIGISSENLIIISGKDNNNNNTFCGLTQQNFVHNIDISNANKVIFHEYNSTIFNYQVNDENLTRKKTLLDSSNNNKYLLEFSSNDVYNCFIDIDENISNPKNLSKKNEIYNINDNSFNSHITYTIYNELENSNKYLTDFDVRTKDLYEINKINDLCLNDISYAYANYTNNSNSHSFVINLLDYLDRNFFDNPLINIPANIINYNNINFIIKDISYSDQTKQFNLYDICANQIILYDKSKIAILNNLQSKLHIYNFKFEYYKKIYQERYATSDLLNIFLINESDFINTLDLQNITTFFDTTNFITNTYDIKFPNKTLNQLYSNIFKNSNLLINRYDELKNAFLYYDYYILSPLNNIYENISNFNLVDQLLSDVNDLVIDVENIIQEIEIRLPENYDTTDDLSLNKLEDYDTLLELTQFYLVYKQRYDIIEYESILRTDETYSNIYDSSFVELFNIYNVNKYYEKLISNMINLNDMILFDISNLSIIDTDSSSNNYCKNPLYHVNNSKYNPIDISYLKILKNDISFNFNVVNIPFNINFNIENKEFIYSKINYVLNGPSIFINAFKSTNILLKIDLVYNSHLFPNVNLDTLVLDITKPDLIPPTIIFNNNNLSINQILLEQDKIDEIIKILIQDISYIELHETTTSDISFDFEDISYTYSKFDEVNIISISNNLIQSDITIEIDISNIGQNTSDNQEVIYKIIDNANNINIINRNIRFVTSINLPKLYYINLNNEINPGSQLPTLLVNENLNTNSIIELARNNIIIRDSQSTTNITKEDASFNSMLIITIVDASNIQYELRSLNFDYIQPLFFYRSFTRTTDQVNIEKEKEHCCFPPSFYHHIQHSYKLGANASYKMRLAKFIINNHR